MTDTDKEYDDWFCAKVNQAIDNPEPRIPHEEVVARLQRMTDKDYDTWFRGKVDEGLKSPVVSNQEVAARLAAIRAELLEQGK